MSIKKAFSQIEFEMRENALRHSPVENEMRFYECVKRGDLDGARASSTPLILPISISRSKGSKDLSSSY